MNKDVLKKHHFWVLAGLVPLFILLAVLLTWTGASSEISAASAKVKSEADAIKGKNPKGAGYAEELQKQKEQLGKVVGKLWESNWTAQRDLIVWPKDPGGRLANFLIDPVVKTADGKPEFRKFGSPLATGANGTDVFEVFTDDKNYFAPFEQAAKLVEPTQFLSGWQSVFRFVRGWGTRTPESDVLWLTLEDLWVQRGLMLPVKEVNDSVAAFRPVPVRGPDGKPLNPQPDNRFTFRSRIWEVEFEIATLGSDKALKAKLTNMSDRLQPLGARNSMMLDVWFDTSPNQEKGTEFRYKIEAEFVKAGETLPVTYLPTFHQLDGNPAKVTKVVQEFDARTVPVRRIDRLQLGWLDNRHQYADLKLPTFIKEPEVSTTPAGGLPGEGGPPAGFGGPPQGFGGPPGGPGPGGPIGRGSPDGPGAGGLPGMGPLGGGSGWESFRQQTQKRYLDVTDQVRRIPVAMVFVVDQDYERDLLIALANSTLRFQITQYHSKRFRGTISTGPSDDSSAPGLPGTEGFGNSGGNGYFGGGLGDEPVGGSGGKFGGRGGARSGGLPGEDGPSGGRGLGGSPRPGGPPAGFGGPPAGFGGPPGGFGGPPSGFGGPPGGFGEMNTGLGETSSSSGLIEMSVYGVVTLYERFETTKSDATSATPAPPEPVAPAPAPTVPMNPMTPTDATPPADKPKQ